MTPENPSPPQKPTAPGPFDDNELMSYFVDPATTAIYREADELPPMDEAYLASWFQSLPDDQRAELEARRSSLEAARNQLGVVHEKLTQTVPELYRATLPAELEARLQGMEYSLGFNQTMASNIEEAHAYLATLGGIDITNRDTRGGMTEEYNLGRRFLLFDRSMDNLGTDADSGIALAIDAGYYQRTDIGRFIVAFPDARGDAHVIDTRISNAICQDTGLLPEDEIIRGVGETGEDTLVNAKYVAGFIDDAGDFWANTHFAVGTVPEFQRYPAVAA